MWLQKTADEIKEFGVDEVRLKVLSFGLSFASPFLMRHVAWRSVNGSWQHWGLRTMRRKRRKLLRGWRMRRWRALHSSCWARMSWYQGTRSHAALPMFWQLLLISWKVWRRPELRVEICLKDKELRGCLDICLLYVSVGLQKDWVNIIWDGYVLIKMSASKSWNGLSSSRFLIAHCVCVNALTCTQYICTVYIAVSGL